jgi:ribosomal protein S18 acetylase RimI-like enzyme
MIIRPATYDDIPAINAMAQVVFRQTYRDILSPEQMEYMMVWMYSPESLAAQMDGGHNFFIAEDDEGGTNQTGPLGYVSVRQDGTDTDGIPVFHLEKIYVMPSAQGRGLGKKLFDTAASFVRKSLDDNRTQSGRTTARLELNVNRNNPAVSFYRKLGMKVLRQGDFSIGGGFYMNDYIMGMKITR